MRSLIIKSSSTGAKNLPFQVFWYNNRTITNRTFEESYNHVVGVFKENVKILVKKYEAILL